MTRIQLTIRRLVSSRVKAEAHSAKLSKFRDNHFILEIAVSLLFQDVQRRPAYRPYRDNPELLYYSTQAAIYLSWIGAHDTSSSLRLTLSASHLACDSRSHLESPAVSLSRRFHLQLTPSMPAQRRGKYHYLRRGILTRTMTRISDR